MGIYTSQKITFGISCFLPATWKQPAGVSSQIWFTWKWKSLTGKSVISITILYKNGFTKKRRQWISPAYTMPYYPGTQKQQKIYWNSSSVKVSALWTALKSSTTASCLAFLAGCRTTGKSPTWKVAMGGMTLYLYHMTSSSQLPYWSWNVQKNLPRWKIFAKKH